MPLTGIKLWTFHLTIFEPWTLQSTGPGSIHRSKQAWALPAVFNRGSGGDGEWVGGRWGVGGDMLALVSAPPGTCLQPTRRFVLQTAAVLALEYPRSSTPGLRRCVAVLRDQISGAKGSSTWSHCPQPRTPSESCPGRVDSRGHSGAPSLPGEPALPPPSRTREIRRRIPFTFAAP